MNIISEIYFNGALCLKKYKVGKYNYITLATGNTIFMKTMNEIDIVCNTCKKRVHKKMNSKHISNLYICHRCSLTGNRNGFFGKHHTKKSKERIGGSVVNYNGKNNPMYGKSVYAGWVSKFGTEIADKKLHDWKLKSSNSHLGTKNSFFGKHHSAATRKILSKKISMWANTAAGKRHVSNMGLISASKSFRITKPQRLVQKYLDDLSIDYTINGLVARRSYDFVLKEQKMLIEVQGTYWHADPRVYGEFKIPLNKRQQFKVIEDELKKKIAEGAGYKLYYIWELDIKNNDYSALQGVINEIQIGSN